MTYQNSLIAIITPTIASPSHCSQGAHYLGEMLASVPSVFLAIVLATWLGEGQARELPVLKELLPMDSPFINQSCLLSNCGPAYANCQAQPKCSMLLSCLDKCSQTFPTDMSPMKSDTESCLATCIFTYADFYFTGFSRCMTENDCLVLPYLHTRCR